MPYPFYSWEIHGGALFPDLHNRLIGGSFSNDTYEESAEDTATSMENIYQRFLLE